MDTPRTQPDETTTQTPVAPAAKPDELSDDDLQAIGGGLFDSNIIDDEERDWMKNGRPGN